MFPLYQGNTDDDDSSTVESTNTNNPQNNTQVQGQDSTVQQQQPPAQQTNIREREIPVPRIQEIESNYLRNPQRRTGGISPQMTAGVSNYDRFLRDPSTGQTIFTQREQDKAQSEGWRIPSKKEDVQPLIDDILASAEELNPDMVAQMIRNPRRTWGLIDKYDLSDEDSRKATTLMRKLFTYNEIRERFPDWGVMDISVGYPLPKKTETPIPRTPNADVSIEVDPVEAPSEHRTFFADYQKMFSSSRRFPYKDPKKLDMAQKNAYDLINEMKRTMNIHPNFETVPKDIGKWDKGHRDFIKAVMAEADRRMEAASYNSPEYKMAQTTKLMLNRFFTSEYVRARLNRYKTNHSSEYENYVKSVGGEGKLFSAVYKKLTIGRGIHNISELLDKAYNSPLETTPTRDDDVITASVVTNEMDAAESHRIMNSGDDKVIRDAGIEAATPKPTVVEDEKPKRDQSGRWAKQQQFQNIVSKAMEMRQRDIDAHKGDEKPFVPSTPLRYVANVVFTDADPKYAKIVRMALLDLEDEIRRKTKTAIGGKGAPTISKILYHLSKDKRFMMNWNKLHKIRDKNGKTITGFPSMAQLRWHPELLGYSHSEDGKLEGLNKVWDPKTVLSTIEADDNYLNAIIQMGTEGKYKSYMGPKTIADLINKFSKGIANPDNMKAVLKKGKLYWMDQKDVDRLVDLAYEDQSDDEFVKAVVADHLASILKLKDPVRYAKLRQDEITDSEGNVKK